MWFLNTPEARPWGSTAAACKGLSVGLSVGLAALGLLALSGCGGGGGVNSTSVSSLGFRIVPAGGTVTPPISGSTGPLTGITFSTQPGVVSSGVQVTVAQTTLTSDQATALTTQVGVNVGPPFQITLSPGVAKFNNAVTLQVGLTDAILPSDTTTLKLFTYDTAAKTWILQPGQFTKGGTANSGILSGTMKFPAVAATPTGPLQDSLSDSQVYIAAYNTPSNLPPPPL